MKSWLPNFANLGNSFKNIYTYTYLYTCYGVLIEINRFNKIFRPKVSFNVSQYCIFPKHETSVF